MRSRNRRIGITGSRATLSSTSTRRAITSRPAAARAQLVTEVQANWLPASETQTSSRLTPPTMSVAPR